MGFRSGLFLVNLVSDHFCSLLHQTLMWIRTVLSGLQEDRQHLFWSHSFSCLSLRQQQEETSQTPGKVSDEEDSSGSSSSSSSVELLCSWWAGILLLFLKSELDPTELHRPPPPHPRHGSRFFYFGIGSFPPCQWRSDPCCSFSGQRKRLSLHSGPSSGPVRFGSWCLYRM